MYRQFFTVIMEGSYQKYHFSAISIKKEVAIRFRRFSRSVSDSHTRTLEVVMDFFERNDLSPNDNLGLHNNRTNKRINAVIAILKNIEKHQTLLTKTMLELLFEKSPQRPTRQSRPSLFPGGQASQSERDMFFKKVEEAIDIKKDNINLNLALKKNRAEFNDLIAKVRLVKSSFGKPRLELDMDPKDFEKLKLKIQKG